MRKLIVPLLLFLAFLFPANSFAQESWVINEFNANISVKESGVIDIKETINVDFGSTEKHGIYRDLPYVYEDASGKTYTEVEISGVLQDGKQATTDIEKNDSNIRIRIGDADKTINGKHSYQINYGVKGVIRPFEAHEELYWNVTGNAWEVPILSATATVTSFTDNVTKTTCFEGYVGYTYECAAGQNDGFSAAFSSTRALAAGEGLTLVIGFEKGSVPIINVPRPVTFFEKFFTLPSGLAILFSVLAGTATVIFLWWRYGRDFYFPGISGYKNKATSKLIKPIGARESVVVEYTPPENLPPGIIGVIADETAQTLDVTSTIVDLASRGFLEIEEIEKKWMFGKKDYILKKLNKDESKLFLYEKELYKRLFEAGAEQKVSDLKTKFYDDLAKVKEKLYQEVVDRKFFETNPDKVRSKYLLVGVALFIISAVGFFISITNEIVLTTDFAIAGIIIGIIVLIFSRLMPRRTALGREMYRRIKGYRLFISTAEKHRQKFFENKNMFNEILPHAIVFGLTEKFAKAMQDMGIKPNTPSWYHGAHAFNAAHFSHDMSDFSNSLSSAIASTPSSSGGFSGGSSGGGFGGGGGGSW